MGGYLLIYHETFLSTLPTLILVNHPAIVPFIFFLYPAGGSPAEAL